MASGKNKITRKDVIDEKVMQIGKDYAKSLEPAIKAQAEWLKTYAPLKQAALEYAELEKGFKISPSRAEFLKLAQEEEVLRKKTAEAVKAEQNALKNLESLKQQYLNTEKAGLSVEKEKQRAKQAAINTDRLSLDLENKKNRAQARTIKLSEQEKLEQRLLNRGKREAAVISSKLSTEYERQAVILTQLRRKYKDVALTEGETSKKAKELQQQIQKLDATLKRVDANVGQFQRNVGNYGKAMASARNAARSLASAMGLVGGAFLIVQVVRDATRVIRDFEKQNATLSAILQVEKSEMTGLTNESQRLGETTVKTAGQVTGLQIAYARLGFAQQEIIDLTEATIAGSIAMNSELSATAELTGAVVNTFDSLKTTDAPEILDILSLATAKSALNFEKLRIGIPIVAGAADAAGIPFTRLVALMGKLADSGIDVSTSSTSLRNIFIESAAQGLNYEQILQKIKDSQDKLTASNDEFGKRAAVSAAVLSKNIDTVGELDDALQGAAGTAQSMADKELDTLDGSIKLLRSAFEGYILSLNDSSGAGETLRDGIRELAENFQAVISTIITAGKIWLAYKTAVLLARVQQSLMNKTMLFTRLASIRSAQGVNIATISWKAFNKVLKANALGIAVAALFGLYQLLKRFNVSLQESIKATNESTEAFFKARDAQEAQSKTLTDLADRYDELTSKTDLNRVEQKELDDIIKKLAKDVPEAVTEIDKYGQALKINTKFVKGFADENKNLFAEQQESTLLKENEEQLARLIKEQEVFNRVQEEGLGFYVKGVGRVANYNGVLKEQEVISGRNADRIEEGNALNSEQIALVQEAIKKNEDQIAQKKIFIEQLTDEGRARIKAREEAAAQAVVDEKLAEEAEVLGNAKAAQALKVSELKEKINELKTEQQGLTRNDKERSVEIKKLIAIYQKEIDAILGVTKSTRNANKAAQERAKIEKRLAADALALQQFSLKTRIKHLDDLANEEEASFDTRRQAIESKNNLEIELARTVAKAKLDNLNLATESELKVIAAGGEKAAAVRLEVAEREKDARLLIEKQFVAEREAIQAKNEDATDEIDVAELKANAQREVDIKEAALNRELQLENDLFNKRQGIYADEENRVENREKRIAEIKKNYAIEALNVQVAAVEALLAAENLSANKRAELEKKLSALKLEISDLTTQHFIDNDDREVLSAIEKTEQILDIAGALTAALVDLANSIFEGRIQDIDEEIQANEDKTAALLANENLSDEQRKEIEVKAEKRRKELEKEKRKEQRKQAILNKGLAVVDIAIATALGIMQSYAQLGPIAGNFGAALVAALGAIQIAAVIAKPIPKYAKGTDNHPGGPAEVAEAQPEVVTEPGKDPYIISKRGVYDLPEGTKVTPSVAEYKRLLRASSGKHVDSSNKKLAEFEARQVANNNADVVEELQKTRRAIEKIKTNVYVKQNKPVDIPHEMFRANNIDWS